MNCNIFNRTHWLCFIFSQILRGNSYFQRKKENIQLVNTPLFSVFGCFHLLQWYDMQFLVKVLFQVESIAEFNMSYKKTYFKGFHEFTLIHFLCSFRTTFHQHSIWPFVFKKYILLRRKECMIQNYRWILCLTYRKNRDSHKVVLNIRFYKGIIFRRNKI